MSLKFLSALAVAACAGAGLFTPAVFAADPAPMSSVREACTADFTKFCAGQEPRSDTGRACMREHRTEFSEPCRTAMETRRREMIERIKAACSSDIAKFCNTGSQTDEGPRHCLRDHKAELSATCSAAFPSHRD